MWRLLSCEDFGKYWSRYNGTALWLVLRMSAGSVSQKYDTLLSIIKDIPIITLFNLNTFFLCRKMRTNLYYFLIDIHRSTTARRICLACKAISHNRITKIHKTFTKIGFYNSTLYPHLIRRLVEGTTQRTLHEIKTWVLRQNDAQMMSRLNKRSIPFDIR